MVTMILAGGFFATVFTWWTPASFIPPDSRLALAVAVATQESLAATALPANAPITALPPATLMPTVVPNRVGIVSGHRGIYPPSGLPDPGAVCDDGTTEQAINEAVAMRVIDLLSGHGYQVDLLDEFDPRLTDYAALAVVSIHADSCQYVNDFATGFKVASFSPSTVPVEDQKLVRCLTERYAETTGLDFHASITFDMTQYHNFREVKPGTPGAIIEIGFMYLDKELLTEQPDVVALGVAQGVLCYLRNELPDS
jgi:N-acetylmuramoyl-L-alanine amidase